MKPEEETNMEQENGAEEMNTAVPAAVTAVVTLTRYTQGLAVIYSRRDGYGELLLYLYVALAVTVGAGGLDYLTCSAAAVAGST